MSRRVESVIQCPESMLYCIKYWNFRDTSANWSMSKEEPKGEELKIKSTKVKAIRKGLFHLVFCIKGQPEVLTLTVAVLWFNIRQTNQYSWLRRKVVLFIYLHYLWDNKSKRWRIIPGLEVKVFLKALSLENSQIHNS